ncbi:MAG TPA: N-acetylmuramoyl-L-alanine amidase [Gemmatimonadales bacterium]
MTTFKRLIGGVSAMLASVTTPSGAQRPAAALPPVPSVHGALNPQVVYPAAGSLIDAGDSTFIFGTVGDGDARLTVAGQPVAVAANGAWVAWIAIPPDSSFLVKLVAHRGADSATSSHRLVRAGWVRETGAWVDRSSLTPVGDVWMPIGEPLVLALRAARGSTVRLILPNGVALRFAADSIADPISEGVRNFDSDDRKLAREVRGDRYVATLGGALNAQGGLEPSSAGVRSTRGNATLVIALGRDTTRIPWPLTVARAARPSVAVVLDDDPRHLGGTDQLTIGRTYPGGTYTWFLPQGTRARADMRIGDQVRLRLSRDAVAWVPAADVHRASAGDDPRPAIMGSPVLTTIGGGTRLRIPLTRPVPASVEETPNGLDIMLYDAVSNANWTRYGAGQHFVSELGWRQVAEDRVRLSVSFDRALWGWRSHVDGTDLVYDFREPPRIDASHPLAGRRIVIDPGHPPEGACGPTGLCEAEANLAVARVVRDQLVAAGATVILTRQGMEDVGLWPRVALADSVDAELLVSIHNNALPDGVNPFTNSGTSTFFNHPHSLALARAVQERLVANLGLRDLGVARGDLALVRPTWYPAILTEGLFMMFPDQESALRTVEVRQRYAAGITEGITAFLQRAARPGRAAP